MKVTLVPDNRFLVNKKQNLVTLVNQTFSGAEKEFTLGLLQNGLYGYTSRNQIAETLNISTHRVSTLLSNIKKSSLIHVSYGHKKRLHIKFPSIQKHSSSLVIVETQSRQLLNSNIWYQSYIQKSQKELEDLSFLLSKTPIALSSILYLYRYSNDNNEIYNNNILKINRLGRTLDSLRRVGVKERNKMYNISCEYLSKLYSSNEEVYHYCDMLVKRICFKDLLAKSYKELLSFLFFVTTRIYKHTKYPTCFVLTTPSTLTASMKTVLKNKNTNYRAYLSSQSCELVSKINKSVVYYSNNY